MSKSKVRKGRKKAQTVGLNHLGRVTKSDKETKTKRYEDSVKLFEQIPVKDLAAMLQTGAHSGCYRAALKQVIINKIVTERQAEVIKKAKELEVGTEEYEGTGIIEEVLARSSDSEKKRIEDEMIDIANKEDIESAKKENNEDNEDK